MPFVLTPTVKICRAKALKERKYQLPVAIFDLQGPVPRKMVKLNPGLSEEHLTQLTKYFLALTLRHSNDLHKMFL